MKLSIRKVQTTDSTFLGFQWHGPIRLQKNARSRALNRPQLTKLFDMRISPLFLLLDEGGVMQPTKKNDDQIWVCQL